MSRIGGIGALTRYFLLAAGLFTSSLLWAGGSSLDQARKLYDLTEYEQSIQILNGISQKSAAALELLGRNYYMQADYKKATEALEKALAAEPGNSRISLWLGRAYGRRAETSSPFTAPSYAGRARQYFEKAVALDARYIEALNDLFEYYLEAPGFLGGGFDKAVGVAERIGSVDPAEGHWARARLAEKRKEFNSAEEQLRRAAELAPQQVGRVLDLARFFAKQGRYQEADQSFQQADQIAPNSPKVMYAKAEVYVKSGRHLDAARQLLKQYLGSTNLTPDDPPRTNAQKLLRQAEGG
jgi:tetratricopeptide (TPR) repeat protein